MRGASPTITEPSRPAAVTILAIALLASVLLLHVYTVVTRADREPHMDETEYLHAGWMMRNGETLYETFFEHHSPFFFTALAALAPEAEAVPVRPYFVHARWLVGAIGLAALIALAATLWPAAPEAAAIAVALLFATGPLWLRGFAEVRAEVFAMAFFLAGGLLVLRFHGFVAGLGLALVAASALWNPKWPLASVAVGSLFLVRERRNGRAYVGAIGGTALTFLLLHLLVPLDVWWFFNFDVNLVLSRAVQNTKWAIDAYFGGGIPFLLVPDAFHPMLVVPAALIVSGALIVKPHAARALPLMILVAALLELRFFLPWPAIWAHYYLMWSVASAAVLGLVPVSTEILMRRFGARERLVTWTRTALVATGALLVTAHVVAVTPVSGDRSVYWVSEKYIRERLRPGDRVWLEPPRHPVTIRDANYYWFSVGQMIPAALELRKTERGRRYLPDPGTLPPCAPSPDLRFTLDPRAASIPLVPQCIERLVATGRAERTVFKDVYELRLIKSAVPSP